MSNRWNTERWTKVGVNEAGDPVYGRTSDAPPLDRMTKAELQEVAAERGLPVSGTKAELIERLNG